MGAKKTTSTVLSSDSFVHLHNHTQYSLLDGLTRVPELMKKVSASGMTAVAMTDHGNMSGAIEFYKSAKEHGVKPIIGIETYIASRKHTDKDPQKDKNRFHLILLAMNNTGYQNLMRLSSIANLEGFYYYPRIDHDLLEQYNEGIIALSACMGGEVADALKSNQPEKAEELAQWYKSVFGDRYYLEIQDHGHPKNPKTNAEQHDINQAVLKLGQKLNIPVVVTCDAHYLNEDDEEAHEILLCVGTGSFLADENRMSLKDFPLFVEEPQNIIERWGKEYPEVITNTKSIADRCNIEIELGKYLIPQFPVPKGQTEATYLVEMTYQGLAKRYLPDSTETDPTKIKKQLRKEVVERADYELGVIDGMGFNGYFLIVQDFINWGKSQGIVFGPGRGSGAGSIIAYALRITELDPLAYDLLFERFLNPDRISMPDFDIDIQDTRRDEVIQYCVEKYGEDRVANIVTFGRMFARNAVRDVARVMQVPYADADRLAKMIPAPVQGRHIPLEKSIKSDADLKSEYENNPESRRVLDQAIRLEGTIRSHGVHAAGVVIAPDEIVKFTPLEMAQKGVVTTQYSGVPVEELGLLKMDFLGLSNLTIIKNTLRIVKKVHGEDIDIESIPLDDKATFSLLQTGDTTGVFQLESAGMKRYLRELKPTVFDDIVAMVALYRPGPMQWIDDFIARKHGKKKIEYTHPAMKDSLETTYGVMVYQEQVMQISKEMCGFTGGQADTLRKAIGKKIPEVMKKMKKEFIDGAIETVGAERKLMEEFWAQLEEFAAYCFNKAHAACYAMIAYQTAYLKAHYPEAFMAALMTSDNDNIDRLAIEISECRHVGIEVLPPDVNESFQEFAVVPDKKQIRFGLQAIKNVGINAVAEIIDVRGNTGPFTSIEDFVSRVNIRTVNRKNMESLVKCGAFDSFGNRHQLLENLDTIMAFAAKLQKEASLGQVDLFGNSTDDATRSTLSLQPVTAITDTHEQLAWERELLGLYLSQHPLDDFTDYLEEACVAMSDLKPTHDGKSVTIGGAIADIREIMTRNGKKMAFVKIEDKVTEMELIVFPGKFEDMTDLLIRDKIVLVRGKISAKDRAGAVSEEVKILVDELTEVTLAEVKNYKKTGKKKSAPKEKPLPHTPHKNPIIYVRVASSNDDSRLLAIKKIIDTHPGDAEVILVVGDAKQALRLPQKVSNESAISQLRSIVGAESIIVK